MLPLPKIREIREALVSLFSPAYTTDFPFEGHVPAEGYRGKPTFHEEECVGCETCSNVCPTHAIRFEDDKDRKIRTISLDYGKCIFCGQCAEHCITGKGISLSDKEFDLAVFDRSLLHHHHEKSLLTCESCGEVMATKDHYHFLRSKLGPRAYASIMNLNRINEELDLDAEDQVRVGVRDGLKRKDMFNVLCPNCLHQSLLKSL